MRIRDDIQWDRPNITKTAHVALNGVTPFVYAIRIARVASIFHVAPNADFPYWCRVSVTANRINQSDE